MPARSIAALLFGVLMLAPALAADPKPDAAIKVKAIEAAVFLDAQIKADPALAENCLAEGRKWIAENVADAAAELKQDPESFKESGWSFERRYSVISVVADRYVSVLRGDDMDTHGAHPNSMVDTILWDKTETKRISIRPFFTETADNGPTMKAMRAAVIASLKQEKKEREAMDTATDEWLGNVKPALLKIGAAALAPSTVAGKSSGLTFYYSPDEVGPHAEGEYVAFVPWTTLKPYLSPEGQRVFGGVQPNDEAEQKQ